MPAKLNKKRRYVLGKILLWIAGIFVVLLLLLTLLLSLSPVQTFLARRVASYVDAHYGIDVDIGRIEWMPSGKTVLENLVVRDHHGDTLIAVRRLRSFILSYGDLKKNRVRLGNTSVESARLYITQYAGEKTDNLNRLVNIIDSLTAGPVSGNPFLLHIKRVELSDFGFRLRNLNIKNENLYSVEQLSGRIEPFVIRGKEVEAVLEDTRYRDLYGLEVKDMGLRFAYGPGRMLFSDLHWVTESSQINGDIRLHYTREQLRRFFDEVEWSGRLQTDLSGADMNLILRDSVFVPGARITLRSDSLEGVLNEWEWNDAHISTSSGIRFAGDMVVFNLMQPDSLGVQLLTDSLTIGYARLEKMMPDLVHGNIPAFVRNAGDIFARGDLVYFPGRLETHLRINSGAGRLQPDLFIHFNNENAYRGILKMDSLNLGRLFASKDLGMIRGRLQIDGQGFDKQTASARLKGQIQRLDYRRYAYRNLNVSGRLRQGKFDGRLDVNDPNFKMNFQGMVHFGVHENTFDFTASLDSADLYRTHWIKSDTLARLSGVTRMRFRGKTLDDARGTWHLENIDYVNSYNHYHLGFMDIHARDTSGRRRIDIRSDKAVNGYLEGKFKMKNLDDLTLYALGTLLPRFKPGKPLQDAIRFNLVLDGNLLELLDPQLEQVRRTRLKGKIDGAGKYVHVDAQTAMVQYGSTRISGARMILDNQNAIYNLYARSDSIRVGNYPVRGFRAIHLNINDTVFVKSKFYGGNATRDTFDLALYYLSDTANRWTMRLMPSYIRFNGRLWQTGGGKQANAVYYIPLRDSLFIDNIGFRSELSQININGFDTPAKRNITVDVHHFNLDNLQNLISPATWAGNANGQILFGKNKGISFYNGRFSVSGFRFNEVPLGLLNGDFRTLRNKVMFVNLYNRLEGAENIRASGFLDFDTDEMDLNLRSSRLPLQILSPFLKDIFDRIRGTASGHIQMTGAFDNPQYSGRLNLFGAGLRVMELNTDYQFDDNSTILIDKDRFVFNRTGFSDVKYQTRGLLDGQIGFYKFSDWTFDLHITGDRLLALDTPGSDEDLYYGTAFVKGSAGITGDLNKIKIDAQLQSREGTKIHIPLRDVETVGEDDFIRFYRADEYRKQTKNGNIRQKRYYEGLELNLDLDITRDAVIDIVLDQEFGSRLTAKGEGIMLLEITTAGKFNMWGTYQVVDGYYDFRYLGIIDKRFEVDAGSTLAWNGDPYHATLNIRAVYHIPAVDITPLLKDAVALQQKVPVDVVINLTGDLMKPRIDFQIELPQANGIIRSQAEYVLSDPDKRMLQVLSLLYSGNFISEDVLKLNSLTAAEGNLSERVLSVFNSLLQNEVFNVKLDYVPGQQNPQNNVKTDSQVGLTVQTKVNKRIYINGKVVMPVGRYTSSSVSGDIEAVLWLNPDGTYQLHVYNKRTPIEYAGQEEGYTQGIGLRFNTDFDTFRELAAKFGFRITTGEENQ